MQSIDDKINDIIDIIKCAIEKEEKISIEVICNGFSCIEKYEVYDYALVEEVFELYTMNGSITFDMSTFMVDLIIDGQTCYFTMKNDTGLIINIYV